ncbi:hypothetical protein J4Q44_G00085090 [Coregonus suidteri]|uniref:Uncharacterized protein n=1 Tax=Coregonus suidteri TaxID=861788 RepID=A0AAN8M1D5_9TELE
MTQLNRPCGNALVFIIIFGTGRSFQNGFHVTVISSPSPYIQSFVNSSWIGRREETPPAQTVKLIWSMYAVGGLLGSMSVRFRSKYPCDIPGEILGCENSWNILLCVPTCFSVGVLARGSYRDFEIQRRAAQIFADQKKISEFSFDIFKEAGIHLNKSRCVILGVGVSEVLTAIIWVCRWGTWATLQGVHYDTPLQYYSNQSGLETTY